MRVFIIILVAAAISVGVVLWFDPQLPVELYGRISGLALSVYHRILALHPFFKFIATLVSIAGGITTVLTYRRWKRTQADQDGLGGQTLHEPPVARKAADVEADLEMLPKAESAAVYLENLKAFIHQSGFKRSCFVPLTGEEGKDPSMVPIEVEQNFEERGSAGARPIDILEAHKRFKQYVLLGPPGSGKTTCLQYLTLKLIEAFRADPENAIIPVFCSLAAWSNRRMSALDFLKSSVSALVDSRNRFPMDLEGYLSGGRLVIILDGLNEMPNRLSARQDRQDMPQRASIDRVAEGFGSGTLLKRKIDPREESVRELAGQRGVRSCFIMSCRTHEFMASQNWRQVHVLPMDPNQIDNFIRRYLPTNHASLSAVLNTNRALLSLAQNPFYLWQMTTTVYQEWSGVKNPGQFMKSLHGKLIEREYEKDRTIDPPRFERDLSRIAFRMMTADMIGSRVDIRRIRKLDPRVQSLGINAGVLVEAPDGSVMFYHQLFQEYFAALAMSKGYVRRSLRRLTREDKWVEILELYQNIASRPEKALRKLVRLLKQRNGLTLKLNRPPVFLYGYILLIPVYGFVTTNFLIDFVFGGGWWTNLAAAYPVTTPVVYFGLPLAVHFLLPMLCFHRKGISNTAFVLGKIRDPGVDSKVIVNLIDAYRRVGVMRQKISEALCAFGDAAVPALLQGLRSKNKKIKKGCIQALGLMKTPEAVEPIIGFLKSGKPAYYSDTLEALKNFDDISSRKAIAEWVATVQKTPFSMIFWIGKLQAIFMRPERVDLGITTLFIKSMDKGRFRGQRQLAISVAGASGDPVALDTLVTIAGDRDDKLCNIAIQALGQIRSPAVAGHLVALIDSASTGEVDDADEQIASAALKALSNLRHRESVGPLIELLDDPRAPVRRAAVQSLGLIGDPKAVPPLLEHDDDLSDIAGEALAEALGKIGSPDAFDGLCKLARYGFEEVREKALDYLDFRYPERSFPVFIEWARDQSFPDRPRLLRMLADTPPQDTDFQNLLFALQADPDRDVAKTASNIYEQFNRGWSRQLKQIGAPSRGSRISRLLHSLGRKSGWTEYWKLLKEEELASNQMGPSRFFAGSEVGMRCQTDPELNKRLRPLMRLFIIFFVLGVAFMGALPVLIYRPILGLGELAVEYMWWSLGIVAFALVFYLPGLRRVEKNSVMWTLIFIARGLAVVLVFCAAVRYGPGLFIDLVNWSFSVMWAYKWITGGVLAAAVVSAVVESVLETKPRVVGVVTGLFIILGLLILLIAILKLVIVHWLYILGFIAILGLVAALVILRRQRRMIVTPQMSEP